MEVANDDSIGIILSKGIGNAMGVAITRILSCHLSIFLLRFTVLFWRRAFCFASAFRDYFLFGNTRLIKAVMLVLAMTLLGFIYIQQMAAGSSLEIPGKIYPVTLGTIIGGLVFGLGMVLAGGCACGTLARMGEGFSHFFLVLAGLVAGSVVGSWQYGWWQRVFHQGIVFLPHYLGWKGALVLQLSVLGLIYFWIKAFEKKVGNDNWKGWEK